MNLTPSDMTQEQGTEIFSRLVKGEHWKGFFGVRRKDSTQFMAYVVDTPVLDDTGKLKFIVGVSADYTKTHNLMTELQELNANLEKEVDARTKQLMEREISLRMVGAAVKESDTGFIITDDDFSVVWVNDAVSRMFNVQEEEILHSLPWNLPIAYYDEGASHATDLSLLFQKQSGTFTITPTAASQGRTQILSVSVQPMSDSKQRMFILRDLTVEHEAASARRAAEAASAASQSKSEIIQMLSHVSCYRRAFCVGAKLSPF
jgi:PAS domain S-box-containing protein